VVVALALAAPFIPNLSDQAQASDCAKKPSKHEEDGVKTSLCASSRPHRAANDVIAGLSGSALRLHHGRPGHLGPTHHGDRLMALVRARARARRVRIG